MSPLRWAQQDTEIMSFIATLIPAWRASKTDPVQVLRYE